MKISWNRSYNHLPRQCIRHLLFLRKEGRKWCEDRLCFLKNNFMVKDIWVHACSLSHVQLFVTPRTIACQAAQSMGCSRKEYWSGLPFPSPEDLPTQGSNSGVLHYRQILYHLSHQEAQSLLEYVFCVLCVCVRVPVRWFVGFWWFLGRTGRGGCTHSIPDLSSLTTYETCICCNGSTGW